MKRNSDRARGQAGGDMTHEEECGKQDALTHRRRKRRTTEKGTI